MAKFQWVRNFLGLAFMLAMTLAQAQGHSLRVRFVPTYLGEALEIDHVYTNAWEENIQFDALRFYVSDLRLMLDEKVVATAPQQHHLVDAEVPESQSLLIPVSEKTKFSKIAFTLGIDSLTNVSGALGGDLDPTKGMYWAWQSGYINFKLEGKTPSCPARNHLFQFHLGGYLPPFENLQHVELPVIVSQNEIVIRFAIDEFLGHINLHETYQVMSPSEKAVELAGYLAKSFKLAE